MIDSYYKIARPDPEGRPASVLLTICAWLSVAAGRILPDMAITAPESTGTVTLTIDGREVSAAGGHDDLGGRQGRRHRHSRAVPRRAIRPGGRLPDVRGGRGRARVRRLLRAGLRERHAGQDGHARGRAQPRHADQAADRPTSRARERDPKQTTTGDNELLALADTVRGEPATPACRAVPAAAPTCRARSSRSTTTPASCATGAPGPATTSRATT